MLPSLRFWGPVRSKMKMRMCVSLLSLAMLPMLQGACRSGGGTSEENDANGGDAGAGNSDGTAGGGTYTARCVFAIPASVCTPRGQTTAGSPPACRYDSADCTIELCPDQDENYYEVRVCKSLGAVTAATICAALEFEDQDNAPEVRADVRSVDCYGKGCQAETEDGLVIPVSGSADPHGISGLCTEQVSWNGGQSGDDNPDKPDPDEPDPDEQPGVDCDDHLSTEVDLVHLRISWDESANEGEGDVNFTKVSEVSLRDAFGLGFFDSDIWVASQKCLKATRDDPDSDNPVLVEEAIARIDAYDANLQFERTVVDPQQSPGWHVGDALLTEDGKVRQHFLSFGNSAWMVGRSTGATRAELVFNLSDVSGKLPDLQSAVLETGEAIEQLLRLGSSVAAQTPLYVYWSAQKVPFTNQIALWGDADGLLALGGADGHYTLSDLSTNDESWTDYFSFDFNGSLTTLARSWEDDVTRAAFVTDAGADEIWHVASDLVEDEWSEGHLGSGRATVNAHDVFVRSENNQGLYSLDSELGALRRFTSGVLGKPQDGVSIEPALRGTIRQCIVSSSEGLGLAYLDDHIYCLVEH